MLFSKRHSQQTIERVESAFPSSLSDDIRAVLEIVPKTEDPSTSHDTIDVTVQGERVHIPYRVYFPEPAAEAVAELTGQQRLVLAAIFTRHSDGFVRERWLRAIGPSVQVWVPPFVVQLLGEYVSEIASAVEDVIPAGLGSYHAFVNANHDYCRVVSARMINYWALYYRRQMPSFDDYPAYRAGRQLGVWRERPPRNRRGRR